MECMALGKAVVATAWSGNMSFMNHLNSCLVGYDLVPVRGGIEFYREEFLGEGAVWAEPHIEEAASWIRKLAHDSKVRSDLGKKAALVLAVYSEAAKSGFFCDEILAIAERPFSSQDRTRKRSSLMRKLNDAAYYQEHSSIKRFGRDFRRFIDRHILWRFSSAS